MYKVIFIFLLMSTFCAKSQNIIADKCMKGIDITVKGYDKFIEFEISNLNNSSDPIAPFRAFTSFSDIIDIIHTEKYFHLIYKGKIGLYILTGYFEDKIGWQQKDIPATPIMILSENNRKYPNKVTSISKEILLMSYENKDYTDFLLKVEDYEIQMYKYVKSVHGVRK